MPWRRLLACVTGAIDQDTRQINDYLRAENQVYRAILKREAPHWRLHF